MNKKVTKKEEVDLIFVKIIHNIGAPSLQDSLVFFIG